MTASMKPSTRLAVVLGIAICFFIAEIAIGFRSKSLALIADAFHYLNDIVAYAIAFAAAQLQIKGHSSASFTYAFQRAELVGAFFNGVFLLALALSIFLQSIERFINIEPVNSPVQIIIIGGVGLALNIVSVLVVHDHGGHGNSDGVPAPSPVSGDLPADVHLREGVHAQHHHTLSPTTAIKSKNLGLVAVLVHLFGDAVNNLGVIMTGLLIWKLHSPSRFYADPAVSLGISLVIFSSAISTTIKAGRILLEAAPDELDLDKVREDLLALPEVLAIHDFHVWVLSQSMTLASLHVGVAPGTSVQEWKRIEQCMLHCFSAYDIKHVTISPEVYRTGSQRHSGDGPITECNSESQDCGEPGSLRKLKGVPAENV